MIRREEPLRRETVSASWDNVKTKEAIESYERIQNVRFDSFVVLFMRITKSDGME